MAEIVAGEYPSLSHEQVERAIRFECCLACPCDDCAWAREIPVSR